MRKLVPVALTLVALALSGSPAVAMQHTLGMDALRVIDPAQDGGQTNLYYQGSLSEDSAFQVGYASGDNSTVLEGGFRSYLGGYHDGPFWQLGVAHYADYPQDGDSETGAMGMVGYEMSPARHLVLTGGVKAVVGVTNPVDPAEEYLFVPSLGVAVAF